MRPALARLHILLATESRLGLVIRHGTAKSVCTLLWDRKDDTFKLGQWMRGRIATDTCDLSPDGKHFIYSARKTAGIDPVIGWTVVSRTPYLKAISYYRWRWGGGWFLNNQDYSAVDVLEHPDDRESPAEVRCVASALPKPSLYPARLVRSGWAVEDLREKFGGRMEFVRSAGSGWDLRHYVQTNWPGENPLRYLLSRGELLVDTNDWEWADIDKSRIVWAAKGCLWAGVLRKGGLQGAELLHDFNGMKFESLIAPYEGGSPIKRKMPPAQVGTLSRKPRPRPPARKKPNRSRVDPDAD